MWPRSPFMSNYSQAMALAQQQPSHWFECVVRGHDLQAESVMGQMHIDECGINLIPRHI